MYVCFFEMRNLKSKDEIIKRHTTQIFMMKWLVSLVHFVCVITNGGNSEKILI